MDEPALSIEERVARLEGSTRAISGHLRQTAMRAAQQEMAALESRLSPLGITGDELRGSAGRDPDLASPLMDRLAGDAGLPYSVGGSAVAALLSGNALDDPRFDTLDPPSGTVALTTSWQDIGPMWEARYTLDSGDAPSIISCVRYEGGDFYATARPRLDVTWPLSTNVGQVTISLRNQFPAYRGGIPTIGSSPAWPYVIAAARMDPAVSAGDGTIVGTVSLIDGSTAAVIVTSDEVDLESLSEVAMEGHPFVWYEDPFDNLTYEPRIQLDVVVTAASGVSPRSVGVGVTEPQLRYTDEPAPPSFQPVLGRWSPVPDRLGCLCVRTATQTIPNSDWTTIKFPSGSATEEYDSFASHSLVTDTGYFYARLRGIYRAEVNAQLQADSTGARQLRISRYYAGGGSKVVAKIRHAPPSTGVWGAYLGRPVYMEPGDYLLFEIWHSKTSGTLDLQGSGGDDDTWAALHLERWMRS